MPTGTPPSYIGYGIEAWGNGAKYSHNLVEGLNNADMISWGTGRLPWEIKDNYVCNPTSKNMIHEEGDWKQTPPLQSGNVISTTCAARASSAPTIAKPNGTYSAPTQVTLIDVGFTAAVGPLATPRSTTQPTVAARPPRRGPIQALSQLRHVYGESDGNVRKRREPQGATRLPTDLCRAWCRVPTMWHRIQPIGDGQVPGSGNPMTQIGVLSFSESVDSPGGCR